MAITALRLIQASQIDRSSLGDIVPSTLSDDAAQAALIDWVEENPLAIAVAEVAVPFQKVTGYVSVPSFVNGRFPHVPDDERTLAIQSFQALWDGAVLSYGRSELNKVIDSNSETYDKDSDQDRIQGNQRLQKLLDGASSMIANQGQPVPLPSDSGSGSQTWDAVSCSVRIRNVW